MTWKAAVCALGLLSLVACDGGNPFDDDEDGGGGGGGGGGTEDSDVPAAILGDLGSIDYDADSNTLTVSGLTQDGVPLVNEYRSVPSFVPGYATFTGQNDPLGRHATAFVASRDGGIQAGVVMTGGQFNKFYGGSYFERSGGYNPPTTDEASFDVTYYGNYAGGINGTGPVTDLLPTIGLDPDVDRPSQTAYVQGLMFVNVDFNDLSVEGEIYDRTATFQSGTLELPDLVLVEGALTEDGTFDGRIEQDASDPLSADDPVGNSIGTFAGVIGGDDGEAMAGGTNIEDFSEDIDDEVEYGVFVLDICTASDPDPICVNATSP